MTITFSTEQQLAFDQYRLGDNLFITGPGGSGKSELIRHIVKDAIERGKKVQVCALTGTAAVLLQCNAKTVHSWAGIGLANGEKLAVANKVNKNKFKKGNWKSVDLLIIDEVSMMSLKLFEILEMTGRLCRKNVSHFGGIQVIFTGDFYQLPPVGREEEPETCQFCFESSLWDQVFTQQIQLATIFRQDDNAYKRVLNQIRVGRITKSTLETLQGLVGKRVEGDQAILPTILYPTRKKVDSINASSLAALEGDAFQYGYSVVGREDLKLSEKQEAMLTLFTQEQKDRELKYMVDNVNFEKQLPLKVGAQVMCIANIDMESEHPICNGSQGVIDHFDPADKMPVVRFKNGVVRKIGAHMWQSETISSVAIKQVPLILAWAITIHKSQGASLDMAEIDVGSGVFECGQTYVALSRIKRLEGLFLKSFDPKKIIINTKVRAFYKQLGELGSPIGSSQPNH
jgi:ATP-dependent DNA helicase PIF1